jgi:membrane protein YqaA with SNARE-associated domain
VKLLVFFLIALAVHGPLSPALPTAFEGTLLYYARLYPAWLLALAGTLGASVAEAVNYRLVDWAAELPKLAALKSRKTVRWSVAAFLHAPFWTTVLVIFSPIPDSAVRVLAPLGHYPLAKFLGAIAVGRFPRLYLIASFGLLVRVPVWLLLASGVALVALSLGRAHAGAAVAWLQSRYRGLGQRLTGAPPRRPGRRRTSDQCSSTVNTYLVPATQGGGEQLSALRVRGSSRGSAPPR